VRPGCCSTDSTTSAAMSQPAGLRNNVVTRDLSARTNRCRNRGANGSVTQPEMVIYWILLSRRAKVHAHVIEEKDSRMGRPERVRTDEFDSAWRLADSVTGWLTRAQGRLLWDAALRLPAGALIVEIGSHQGRSTIVLGAAARIAGARVVAVDPFVDGTMFGGAATRLRFEENILAAGLTDIVELTVGYSTELRPGWNRQVDLLHIDGKHDYWTSVDDLLWSEHMPAGREILVHDCYSSVGVTLGTLVKVLCGARYTYLDRAGSMARFRLGRPTPRDRFRLLRQLPWFARNAVIKTLLYARLRVIARWLGHDSPYAPY